MSNGCRLVNFECGCLADFGTEMLTKPVHIIGENHRLLTGARHGNVAEAGAEQVGMDAGVGVDEDALGVSPWALWLVTAKPRSKWRWSAALKSTCRLSSRRAVSHLD